MWLFDTKCFQRTRNISISQSSLCPMSIWHGSAQTSAKQNKHYNVSLLKSPEYTFILKIN